MVDAQHLQLLTAMGVDVYALRPRAPAAVAAVPAAATATALVIVSAHGVRGAPHLARLLRHLPQAVGIADGAIAWLEADAQGALTAPPSAPAYLVLGATMARALGMQLSTAAQNAAAIAVTAEPAQLLGSSAAKRALWQVLKPLARQLRVGRG